jgi:hypothetical protein
MSERVSPFARRSNLLDLNFVELSAAASLAGWREKAGMEGWMKWAKDDEASIVDLGSPLGKYADDHCQA